MKTYQQNENQYYTGCRAKLTRDGDNRRIAGVCSGLGRYFGIDVSLVRVAWFLLAFFGIFSAGISTFMVVFVYFYFGYFYQKRERFTISKKENSNIFLHYYFALHITKNTYFCSTEKKFVK